MTIQARFDAVRTAFDFKASEEWLPRPAVSNSEYDPVAEIDLFSDNSCSEPLAMGENINPYKMLHDLNFMMRKYTGSPADPV